MTKPSYKYTLEFSEPALEALRALQPDSRRQIGHAMDGLQRNFSGDVKKLKGWQDRYRLRVGHFRVLFRLVKNNIEIYRISDRKNAYEN